MPDMTAFKAVRREQFQTLRDAITALKNESDARGVGLVLDLLELIVRGQDGRIQAIEDAMAKTDSKTR